MAFACPRPWITSSADVCREFEHRTNQLVYVSGDAGTKGADEVQRSVVVEQNIRPTGLIDPEVEVRPVKGQIDDLLAPRFARA